MFIVTLSSNSLHQQANFFPIYSENCTDTGLHGNLQTLTNGLCDLLSVIFDCDRFANELLTNFHDDHIRVCLEIMKLLLQSSAVNNSHYFNYVDIEHKNIMYHVLCVCIPKGKNNGNELHFKKLYLSYLNFGLFPIFEKKN